MDALMPRAQDAQERSRGWSHPDTAASAHTGAAPDSSVTVVFRIQQDGKIISQLPKYAFETIAFGGILIIIIYLLAVKKVMALAMKIISIYAFAGYRLMNAMHVIYLGVSECKYNSPAFELLYRDLTADGDTDSAQYSCVKK